MTTPTAPAIPAKPFVTLYSISDHGWLTSVNDSINTNKSCAIRIAGKDAIVIIGMIHNVANSIPWDLFPGLPKETVFNLKKATGIEQIAGMTQIVLVPAMVAFVFGSVGALGGALGSVGFCVVSAQMHGMKIVPCIVRFDPLNFMNDEMHIDLVAK